jgi:hypothetical protein
MIRAALLLLLVPAVPLQAQSTPSTPYSSLWPKVTRFRFYPSGKDFFPSAERVYRSAFDSATVQYINFELGIEYPRTPVAASFTLDCRYQGPAGKTGTVPLNAKVEADWKASKHTGGWGHSSGGYWPAGSYRVTCRDGATEVASGSFEVTRNQHDIAAIKAMVTRVRVLESPRRLPPFAERVYGESFDSATARYISTQIEIDFPPAAAAAQFPIDCTYKFPNGETRNFRIDARVDAGWKDSAHTGGWGNDVPGTWPKGTYEITCSHADRQLFLRTFHIQ